MCAGIINWGGLIRTEFEDLCLNLFLFCRLDMEPGASCMLSKFPPAELHAQPRSSFQQMPSAEHVAANVHTREPDEGGHRNYPYGDAWLQYPLSFTLKRVSTSPWGWVLVSPTRLKEKGLRRKVVTYFVGSVSLNSIFAPKAFSSICLWRVFPHLRDILMAHSTLRKSKKEWGKGPSHLGKIDTEMHGC